MFLFFEDKNKFGISQKNYFTMNTWEMYFLKFLAYL